MMQDLDKPLKTQREIMRQLLLAYLAISFNIGVLVTWLVMW